MYLHCPQKGHQIHHESCKTCNIRNSCDAKQTAEKDRRNGRIVLVICLMIILGSYFLI